jgi:hypothetical protein
LSAPTKTEMIAEGKATKIYATTDPTKLIFYFKDDATAFNAQKKDAATRKKLGQGPFPPGSRRSQRSLRRDRPQDVAVSNVRTKS